MRLIDVDALKKDWSMEDRCEDCPQKVIACQYDQVFTRMDICQMLDDAPTVGGWISVEDRLPEETESMFARFYATEKWDRAMWKNESETVLVCVLFPDGGRKVTVGRLHDGKWNTTVSKVLPHKVTHWMPLPEPPEVPHDAP